MLCLALKTVMLRGSTDTVFLVCHQAEAASLNGVGILLFLHHLPNAVKCKGKTLSISALRFFGSWSVEHLFPPDFPSVHRCRHLRSRYCAPGITGGQYCHRSVPDSPGHHLFFHSEFQGQH